MRALVGARPGAGERRRSDPGILAASGLVAGEGLAGVLIAGLVAAGLAPKPAPWLAAGPGDAAALAVLLLSCYFLYRGGRTANPSPPPTT